jgi:hypothetical protein
MARLFEAVSAFRTRAKSGRTGAQLGVEMARLRLVVDLIELEFSEMAGEFARTDEYDQQGSVSPIDWIRFNCHMTSNAAGARVAVGRNLPQLSESIQAVSTGQIGFAHLIVMARTADALPGPFDEKELLVQARENSPGKLHHISQHYRHSADAKGYAAEQAEQVENRRLSLSRWEDGSYLISGVLDAAGGAALRTALEPLARKSGKDDDRSRERRVADALVEFVHRSQPAQLQVTTSLETLLGLAGAPAAELEYSLPISAKTVERLACDCSLTRILLGSESTVIDVGRSKRVVSGPGRKALQARDGHCRWPGCDRPAKWSAAHHVVHWIRGGTTDLDNLILLCHRHHWMVHEGKWQIVRADDGRMLTIPPTIAFAQARSPSAA